MFLLRNPIQPYAWGPVDGIAHLVGSEPTGGHEAELWIGTHPRGPSVIIGGEHDGRTLADVIAEDPARYLGDELAAQGHTALPFLLKVLAIDAPLSLQAHPSAEQAREGYDREEAAGIPKDSPERLYADPYPKPEMLVALEDTDVLSGFRPAEEAAALVADLHQDALAPMVERLGRGGSEGLKAGMQWLLELTGDDRARVAAAAEAGAKAYPMAWADSIKQAEAKNPYWWVARLAKDYPGDPACLAPLLLELRRLVPPRRVKGTASRLPGQGATRTILPAGNLHAYLHGAGIEIMAASDNVLRGGLTPKHVDPDELLRILDFQPPPDAMPRSSYDVNRQSTDGGRRFFLRLDVIDPEQDAFGLVSVDRLRGDPSSRVSIAGALSLTADPDHEFALPITQPSVLLALDGLVQVRDEDERITIGLGTAAFVGAGESVTVSGPGNLWWATTRAGLPPKREPRPTPTA